MLFLTPLDSDIHLPSDLLGMTAGRYESKRYDRNSEAAVSPFCGQVRKKIAELGFVHSSGHNRLRELATMFECSEWIVNLTNAEPERVEQKRRIFEDMVTYCQRNPVNKRTLLQQHRLGSDVALAAAITANPESEDDQLILDVQSISVGRGFAQHAFVDAMLKLASEGKLSAPRRSALVRWTQDLRASDPNLAPKIAKLSSIQLPG